MSIYFVNILSVCLSVILQKALLLMDVFNLVSLYLLFSFYFAYNFRQLGYFGPIRPCLESYLWQRTSSDLRQVPMMHFTKIKKNSVSSLTQQNFKQYILWIKCVDKRKETDYQKQDFSITRTCMNDPLLKTTILV